MWDYSRLKGRTREAGLRQEDVGSAIGLTPTTYSLKLNCKAEFKQREIERICKVLNIPFAEIPDFFLPRWFRKLNHRSENRMKKPHQRGRGWSSGWQRKQARTCPARTVREKAPPGAGHGKGGRWTKFDLTQEQLTATIEALRDYLLRLEIEAAALASLHAADKLVETRLEQAEVVRELFEHYVNL